MGLRTIFLCQNLQLATMARMKLESEGIAAHIPSAETITTTGLANALGGVKLQLDSTDEEVALSIIDELKKEIGL